MAMKLILGVGLLALVCKIAPTLDITMYYSVEQGLPKNEVRAILNDPIGSMWIGSGGGAAYLENGVWKIDAREINPVVNGVSTIFKDSRGDFWFGGLNECHLYDNHTYETFSISEDLGIPGRVLFSFYEDNSHNIWAATTGGVSIYNGKDWQPFAAEDGLRNSVVHDIEQDEKGDFWFATRKGGLNIFNGEEWIYLFPEKNCRKILRDDLGLMWVGTNDGILKFDGDKWQEFEKGNTILPMFKGPKGLVWCISNGVDIIRINIDGKTIHYENPTGGKCKEIYDLTYSEDGSIWAGTDQGVFVFH